jgi:CRP/FNR family transcriptional regulator
MNKPDHPRSLGITQQELNTVLDNVREAELIPASVWEEVRDMVEFSRTSAGRVLVWEGDSLSAYHLLLEGALRVQKRAENGRQITLFRILPGESCAMCIACLLSGRKSPVEIVAESALVVATLSRQHFFRLLSESEAFRHFVFASYGSQLSGMLGLATDLAFEQVSIRLARYLLHNRDENDRLKRSHQQIAEDLGTVREVISREIRAFKAKDVIQVARGQITIVNPMLLAELALGYRD